MHLLKILSHPLGNVKQITKLDWWVNCPYFPLFLFCAKIRNLENHIGVVAPTGSLPKFFID